MIRYYSYYSNVKRAICRKNSIIPEYLNIKEPTLSSKKYHRRWSELIKKIYEIDSLICPKCGGKMSIIAFIKEQPIIDKILSRKGLFSGPFPFPTTRGFFSKRTHTCSML